jgi:hypothetical protein
MEPEESNMSDELPVPRELQHLIEKRRVRDRRRRRRRAGKDRRQLDLGPLGTLESASGPEQAVLEERRGCGERRTRGTRRKSIRRRGGAAPPRGPSPR